MKKILLTICLALVFSYSKAQFGIGQGAMLMGGNASFSFSTIENEQLGSLYKGSEYSVIFSPSMAYFFGDNFCAGANISLNNYGSRLHRSPSAVKDTVPIEQNQNLLVLSVGPFARFYYSMTQKTAVFGELNLGIGVSSFSRTGASSTGVAFGGGIGPGLAFFINNTASVEALLKYNYLRANLTGTENAVSESIINNNVSLGIGFQLYFYRTGRGIQ